MKKIFLVASKTKSNHVKVLAAFESERLAEIYSLHKGREIGSEYLKFFVQEVRMLDEDPVMNRIILSGSSAR